MNNIVLNQEMSDILDQFKIECSLRGMGKNSTTSYASAMRIFCVDETPAVTPSPPPPQRSPVLSGY